VTAPSFPIDSIIIGERHRRDLGDIAGLAASMDELGLLQPIPILADGRLVGGARRLEAAKALGWTEIPVHVVDIDEVIRGEFAENTCRKDFTPSELVAIGAEVERIERERAKARMVAAHASPGKLPEQDKGDARDKIAAQLGISGRTYEKAKAVVDAAAAEPERYGHLVEELDRYRGVDRAFRALRCARDEARVLGLQPREGKFRTLIVDVPWEYDNDFLGRGAPQYALMGRDEALALPIPSWAEDNSHLYLWATNANLPMAVDCMAAWGFTHKSVLTWVKPRFGLGVFFRGSTEHVLFGVRGQLMTRSTSIATHFEAPVGEHSEKPERFYEIVREASYPPYGEAFQRKARPDFVNLYEPVSDEAPHPLDIPPYLRRTAP
jgi:N6-adenosine-specific RNA methylase IME4/ParB-like chromosome segregation protein Spo0J